MSFRICPVCGAECTSYSCDECGQIERTTEQRLHDALMMQGPTIGSAARRLEEENKALTATNAQLAKERDALAIELAGQRSENLALRFALVDVCDSHESMRIERHYVRAVRAAANYLRMPFSLPEVHRYASHDHDNADAWCQNLAADCADRDELIEDLKLQIRCEQERATIDSTLSPTPSESSK